MALVSFFSEEERLTETQAPPTDQASKKPRTSKKPSLVSKLAEVQASLDRLEKTAVADMGQFQFPYVEEHQVLEALRMELASRHIMIFPEITDITKEGQFVTLRLMFHIRDGESGEIISSQWASHAADSRDFAVGKATTQAVKYYLLKTFLLPTSERLEDANGVKAKTPVAGDLENNVNRDRVEEPRQPGGPLESPKPRRELAVLGEPGEKDTVACVITKVAEKKGGRVVHGILGDDKDAEVIGGWWDQVWDKNGDKVPSVKAQQLYETAELFRKSGEAVSIDRVVDKNPQYRTITDIQAPAF